MLGLRAMSGLRSIPAGAQVVCPLEKSSMPEAPSVPGDVSAPPDDAETTASGLATKVLRAGTSDQKPTASDTVEVHYSGWTTDGELFDSSVTRGETISFGLRQVIAGWTEGVQLMSVGESRRLWIPEDLAYQGRPGSPAGMLVFDVELISIRGR
jgi:FKBP-type peptidyl-prolyl cis-trans isomerase